MKWKFVMIIALVFNFNDLCSQAIDYRYKYNDFKMRYFTAKISGAITWIEPDFMDTKSIPCKNLTPVRIDDKYLDSFTEQLQSIFKNYKLTSKIKCFNSSVYVVFDSHGNVVYVYFALMNRADYIGTSIEEKDLKHIVELCQDFRFDMSKCSTLLPGKDVDLFEVAIYLNGDLKGKDFKDVDVFNEIDKVKVRKRTSEMYNSFRKAGDEFTPKYEKYKAWYEDVAFNIKWNDKISEEDLLMDCVQYGKSFWGRYYMVPIYRNGRIHSAMIFVENNDDIYKKRGGISHSFVLDYELMSTMDDDYHYSLSEKFMNISKWNYYRVDCKLLNKYKTVSRKNKIRKPVINWGTKDISQDDYERLILN